MADEVKLFSFWSSPFVLRVEWALKLKGIEYETIDEDLPNKSPLLLQYNPIYKKVPVLLHNGKPICGSMIILEYLDDIWKQYPLFPQDPLECARARFWAKFGDEKVLKSIYHDTFVKQGKEQEEGFKSVIENLNYLENELRGKKFFGGEKIGAVDLALGWLAQLPSVFEDILCIKFIDPQQFPLLAEWVQEFANVPIIRQNWPPRDKVVARFVDLRKLYLAKQTAE